MIDGYSTKLRLRSDRYGAWVSRSHYLFGVLLKTTIVASVFWPWAVKK